MIELCKYVFSYMLFFVLTLLLLRRECLLERH
ncbi:unnamed protein product [Spirodela intermedia]|uniref:Uncharacterized protein n=1 Tax=Spirodela intermedia TaxID=51605 RepID=A0A7I8I9J0_SPIIN|nr:unnamed protein product [Spirodela intermedia]CAA6654188.1 unnamed protein product [Spirodela intermedia]